MKLEYANELNPAFRIMMVVFTLMPVCLCISINVFLSTLNVFLALGTLLLGILVLGIISIIILKQHKNTINRRNGIMLNGIKVQGIAKKRENYLYVTYIDSNTKEEVGFNTPQLAIKAPRDVQWTCDVYILGSEKYATNFKEITT